MRRLASLLVLAFVLPIVLAVDRHKFRTCEQTAFCKRHRKPAFDQQSYQVVETSLTSDESSLKADLINAKYPLQSPLQLSLNVVANGMVRFAVREKAPLHPRFEVPDIVQSAALQAQSVGQWQLTPAASDGVTGGLAEAEWKVEDNTYRVSLATAPSPLKLTLYVNGAEAIVVNSQNLFDFEQYRVKQTALPPPAEGEDPEQAKKAAEAAVASAIFPPESPGMWEESFSSHSDSKPRGPAAVAFDVLFSGSNHVYGIPEHASSFALQNTVGQEPYRLFNLDVFEYELDSPMALYGAVPFMMSHDAAKSVAMLFLNAAEMFIDIEQTQQGKHTHWMSESGIIDTYFFLGPSPKSIWESYARLTGFAQLPQRFATGYHQCRWNYKSEEDVAQVDAGFDEHDIPYDVIWLDIEHTDGKKYLTWDNTHFPSPKNMQDAIAAKTRKMVTIVDPHIKRDSSYFVHNEAQNKYYVKTAESKGNSDYEGWCWPGSVSYLDFLRPEVRAFWAGCFSFDRYAGSTPNLFTWNDMNEPSVFNGPEVTMPKDCLHSFNGQSVEHRDVHNLYGFYVQWATVDGQLARSTPKQRPFVLTRAFFAGSQRYGAVWTGDNKADWGHLQAASPMLLSLGLAGITFSGADVGGFFGDPDAELLTRWYQSAALTPFFRGHAHIDAKRREPWVFGEPTTSRIRQAIRMRYTNLPYLYTAFFESSATGTPILRPLFSEFPKDSATFGIENQFMLGSAIMVANVFQAGITNLDVYLPAGVWYSLHDGTRYVSTGQSFNLPASIDTGVPILVRGGSIVVQRRRARRSSSAMDIANDPYTLLVALDENQSASGYLYLDDGHSFDYALGAYSYRSFTFTTTDRVSTLQAAAGQLPASWTVAQQQILSAANIPAITRPESSFSSTADIERVVVWGAPTAYAKAELSKEAGSAAPVTLVHQTVSLAAGAPTEVVVRKPAVAATASFSVQFSL